MEILVVLVSLVALLLGVVVGYLYGRRSGAAGADARAWQEQRRALTDAREDAATARTEAARAREDSLTAKADLAQHIAEKSQLQAAVAQAQQLVAEAQGETARVAAEVAAAQAQRDAAVQRAAEQAADREALLNQFKVLSAESLEAQETRAEATAEVRLKATEQLVTPLTEGLRQMHERLQLVEKERIRMAAELGQQVDAVRVSGEEIRRETRALSRALRTPQVRGAWGERSLQRLVELSGLTDRCDFDTQHTYARDDGRLRPDLRVNLPAGKVIFVDAKVPLASALEAYNTEDERDQRQHFAAFSKRVRAHIDDLAGKNYWQLDLGSPEFVILYLPSDELYRLALELEPDLHDYATRKHIVLASPGLLIPQLQIVANGWRQVSLAETAGQISKLGRELYDRLATLGSHFDKLGRSLNTSVSTYNKAVATLETRVMVSARRFRDLEVTSAELDELSPVSESTRQITAAEMLAFEEHPEDSPSEGTDGTGQEAPQVHRLEPRGSSAGR